MLRFDEEAHVQITKEDFKQVKTQVSLVMLSMGTNQANSPELKSPEPKDHSRGAKNSGLKLKNTLMAIKSFNSRQTPLGEFKVQDDQDELNVKDMIRSSSAKPKITISKLTGLQDDPNNDRPQRQKSFLLTRQSSTDFSKKETTQLGPSQNKHLSTDQNSLTIKPNQPRRHSEFARNLQINTSDSEADAKTGFQAQKDLAKLSFEQPEESQMRSFTLAGPPAESSSQLEATKTNKFAIRSRPASPKMRDRSNSAFSEAAGADRPRTSVAASSKKETPKKAQIQTFAVDSVSDGWKLINLTVRTLRDYICRHSTLKMFSRDTVKRVMRMIEKKKDDAATKHMKDLEERYGKKIISIYNKGRRFVFMGSQQNWNGADVIVERAFLIGFNQYQFAKFKASFDYAKKLIARPPELMAQDFTHIPPMCDSREFYSPLYEEKTTYWFLKNIHTYSYFVFYTETMCQKICKYVSFRVRKNVEQFHAMMAAKMEEGIKKHELLQLVSLLNFRFEESAYLKGSFQIDPILTKISTIILEKVRSKIEWQLTNLFLSYAFFLYYRARKNDEKGYVVLSRAYDENKASLDLYLGTYIKYFCTRDQLHYFLTEPERRHHEPASYPDISYTSYAERLGNLETRIPYIYDYVENTLFDSLMISDIKEILKTAGYMALQLNDFPRALMYFENYLFIVDSIDRVELHRFLVNGKAKAQNRDKIKVEKVNRILELNKEYMKYSNYVLKACFETKQYIKALTIILNLLFIFNNSLNLINYFDPHSHPTKKPNDIIMMDLKTFESISDKKKKYKALMMFYIAEWRTAMDFHSKIWDTVSQVSNKDNFKQSFFLAFRESVDHVETLPLHNLQAYLAFVSRYTNLPTVLAKGDTELRSSEHLTPSTYERTWQMDYYFPTYVGDFDKSFIETKVLELIYMNHHNQSKIKRLTKQPSKKLGNSIMEDTESFKSKRVKKLHIEEVKVYFSLPFEDVRLSNALFRNILRNYYLDNKKSDESYAQFVQTALMNADQHTLKKLHEDFSRLQAHWRKELQKRDVEYQKLRNRKLVTWGDKLIRRDAQFEDVEAQNIIRNVERRVIHQEPHKASRFFNESKLVFSQANVGFHLNEYENEPLLRHPKLGHKKAGKPRRPSVTLLQNIPNSVEQSCKFDSIRAAVNTAEYYRMVNLQEDKQPKFKRKIPQFTVTTPTMNRKAYPSPNLEPFRKLQHSLKELPSNNNRLSPFATHMQEALKANGSRGKTALTLPKYSPAMKALVGDKSEMSRKSRGEATVIITPAQDEDSADTLEKVINGRAEPDPWPVEAYGGELMLSFRSEFVQEGTEANHSLVDYSLRKIQQRSYTFKVQLPRTVQGRFFASCTITGTNITFKGYLRTSKSGAEFPFAFEFPLSKDIIQNKEEYFLAYNTTFQTYWPILFKQFKDDYLAKFYDLTKEQRLTILGRDQSLYKHFVQNLGLGFDLSYTDFREPLDKIKDKQEYAFYHRVDFHALQILNSNLEVVVRLLDSLVYRSLHGYNQRFSVSLDHIIEILSENKLNLGVFQFKQVRTFNYLLKDAKKLQDRLLLRERYSNLKKPQMAQLRSTRAYVQRLRAQDSPSSSQHSPNLEAKQNKLPERRTKAADLGELFQECLEFMEIFSLKMQMINLSRGKHPSDEFFLCKKMCNFFRIHPCMYSLDMKLIVHSQRIQDNIEFFKKSITTFDQEILVWEQYAHAKLRERLESEAQAELTTADIELVRNAQNLRENFLIFILFVFMEKTFEFELRSNHPFLDLVPHYKSKGQQDDSSSGFTQRSSKKFIFKRNRFFKADSKSRKISFLQLYFLGRPFSKSRPKENMLDDFLTSHEFDKHNFLDVWDFGLLANKESILKELKQEFDNSFQLHDEIRIYKDTIVKLFKSILFEPVNNRSLRSMALRALERKQYLKCFLREKNLYHVLEFRDEETRLIRNEFSEYTFEYDKFHTYIQADKKLIDSDIVQMIMRAIDPDVDDMVSIKDLTLSIRIREFLVDEPRELTGHRINSIGKVETSMIKIGEKAGSLPNKKLIRPLLALPSQGTIHGLASLMNALPQPANEQSTAKPLKVSRSVKGFAIPGLQKEQDSEKVSEEGSIPTNTTVSPIKPKAAAGMIGLNSKDSAFVRQMINSRKQLANKMEQLFGPTFEEILSRNFLNENLKSDAQETDQGFGDKLEVFSDSSDLISKSKLIYASTQYPISSMIRKYSALKDRNNNDLLKTIDPNAAPYYSLMAALETKVHSEWMPNFNIDHDGLVRLFVDHWQANLGSPKPLRLRKHFASFGSRLLLSNHVYQPFNLVFVIDYALVYHKDVPRVLVHKIDIHVYYLARQSKIKLQVTDPYNLLMLMRILRLKSDALQFVIFKQHFGRHLASYLSYGLKQKKIKFYKHQSSSVEPVSTAQISMLGIPTLDAIVMLPGFTKPPKIPLDLSLMSSHDLEYERSSKMNAVFPRETSCFIDKCVYDPATAAEERWNFSPMTELRIVHRSEAETKMFKKSFGIGFANPLMKKHIKQRRIESNMLNHTADGFKHQISFSNEMTGSPVLYVPHYKHFQFYLNSNIGNLGDAYITANVYLILQRPPLTSDQTTFEDVHTVRDYFLETIANRLKNLSKLFFKDAVITKDDLFYIKIQSARNKARKALGISSGGDLIALDHWSKTMTKIEFLLHQYSSSKFQAEAIKKGKTNLLSYMWNLKDQQKQDDKLILPGEVLLFALDITPKNSRTCVHKIVLSWTDVRKFFVNDSFFKFLFPRVRTYQEGLRYFSKTTPNHLFMELLRFILSNCHIMKQRIYSAPIILLDNEVTRSIYIKNTFSKFNKTQGASSQKAAEMFSRNSQVVYQGVRRLGNQYQVITVMKNRRLRTFEIIFYNPKYCREYCITVQASTLAGLQVAFLGNLCRFMHEMEVNTTYKMFEDFDKRWGQVNKRSGAKSINLNSDTSLLQGAEQVNDSGLDPSEHQSINFETSLLQAASRPNSPDMRKQAQSQNFGWKQRSSQTPNPVRQQQSGFAAASDLSRQAGEGTVGSSLNTSQHNPATAPVSRQRVNTIRFQHSDSRAGTILIQAEELPTSPQNQNDDKSPQSPLKPLRCLADILPSLDNNRLLTLEEIINYMQTFKQHLKTSALTKIIRLAEDEIFLLLKVGNVRLKDGNVRAELFETHPEVLLFCNKLEKSIAKLHKFLEVEFWEGVCNQLEVTYVREQGIKKMIMKIEQQSYHLRELFGMREIASPSGEEMACRVFLNFDKLQSSPNDQRSAEVVYHLTKVSRQLQRINQPFPRTHVAISSYIMLEIHIYITRSNLETSIGNPEKGKSLLTHMNTLKVKSGSGKVSKDKSVDASSGNEEPEKAEPDDSYNQMKSNAELPYLNRIQVGSKIFEQTGGHGAPRPQRAKKLKNLKELINLVTAEHQHLSELRTNKLLYLSDFRTLAQYMLYKMKQTDNFSNLMEQKIFDELDEIAEPPEEPVSEPIGSGGALGEDAALPSPANTPQAQRLLEPPTPRGRGSHSPAKTDF